MRIAIDLKRGENAEVIVNNLFQNTQLENSFSINMVCLDNGQPKLMNLKDIIAAFIRHRQEVVTRRTMYELRKARERGHILEGLTVALANIDAIIETIKTSANPAEARERLQAGEWAAGGVAALLEKQVLFLYVRTKLKVKIQSVHLVLMAMCIVYLRLKLTRSWNCVCTA